MAVRLIVTFTAQPGRGQDFVKAWAPRLAEVRQEPGCEQYELFQSTERPDTVVLLERWSSSETLATHTALNQTRPPLAPELRGGPPTAERFEVD